MGEEAGLLGRTAVEGQALRRPARPCGATLGVTCVVCVMLRRPPLGVSSTLGVSTRRVTYGVLRRTSEHGQSGRPHLARGATRWRRRCSHAHAGGLRAGR